jgi:acyl carrier protein
VEILAQVKHIVAKTMKVPIEQLTANTKLEDLSGTSMNVVDIILQLEEKFEINIPIELAKQFETIVDIENAVKSLVDAKPRGRTVS